jgi:hypothetical protein
MQGKEKEIGGWWLKWHHHQFEGKVENVVYAFQIEFVKKHNRDTIWQACHDFGSAVSMFCRVSNRDTISGKRDTIFGLLGKFWG